MTDMFIRNLDLLTDALEWTPFRKNDDIQNSSSFSLVRSGAKKKYQTLNR